MGDLDWFGESPDYDSLRRKNEKNYRDFTEYIEASRMQFRLQPINYDDQIDFHNWLRDTPDEYIFFKLGDKRRR